LQHWPMIPISVAEQKKTGADMGPKPNRRIVVLGAAATLAAPVLALAQTADTVRNNTSAFRTYRWQDHFENTQNGVILADTASRVVHFWSEDESIYRLWPSSVPISEELTRRGTTSVVKRVEGPTWTPTPSMRIRFPEYPAVVPAGPTNPLGTHALYLSWQYYRIHGTHDTRKIGRESSDGCIGLYNEHIAELFALAQVGTQVKLI
jgi:L,D-transpeptidase ErfK/SrfK